MFSHMDRVVTLVVLVAFAVLQPVLLELVENTDLWTVLWPEPWQVESKSWERKIEVREFKTLRKLEPSYWVPDEAYDREDYRSQQYYTSHYYTSRKGHTSSWTKYSIDTHVFSHWLTVSGTVDKPTWPVSSLISCSSPASKTLGVQCVDPSRRQETYSTVEARSCKSLRQSHDDREMWNDSSEVQRQTTKHAKLESRGGAGSMSSLEVVKRMNQRGGDRR